MDSSSTVAILIPSLNPNSQLPELVAKIRHLCNYPIILVDDGSNKNNACFFEEAAKNKNVILIHHAVNLGKGRALKTGFNDYLNRFPDGIGVCTADGDGQHLPEDIIKCCDALKENPRSLVLGVRNFSEPGVPWKSYFGNTLTSTVFRLIGKKISDTQTGLRGIGSEFMKQLMNSFGERFEFETVMLLDAAQWKICTHEVPIQTVYLNSNSETHFNPLKDSIRIYRVILKRSLGQIVRFSFSGLISFSVDISLYSLLFYYIVPRLGLPRLFVSVAVARACSLVVNYLLNHNFVFKQNSGTGRIASWHSFGGYLLLCGFIMCISYYLTRGFLYLCPSWNAVLCKTVADIVCFFISFSVQKRIIFAF